MKSSHPETSFAGCKDVVACELDDGVALLDLRVSKYYKLNKTAALIWDWMSEPATVDQLVTRITERFDVSESECRADILAILASFESSGLIEERASQPT